MKIIRYLYESVALVDCSCCMEDHTAKFDICKKFDSTKDDNALYISIKNRDDRLRDRIKNSLHLVFNWKKYIDGEFITSHGILINREQIKELYPLLRDKLFDYNILKQEDIALIEKDCVPEEGVKIPIKWINKDKSLKRNDFTWVLYNDDEFVISVDITKNDDGFKFMDNDIVFGFKLHKNIKAKDVRRWAFYHILYNNKTFIGGNWESFVSKSNTVKMLSVFYYLIHNLKEII